MDVGLIFRNTGPPHVFIQGQGFLNIGQGKVSGGPADENMPLQNGKIRPEVFSELDVRPFRPLLKGEVRRRFFFKVSRRTAVIYFLHQGVFEVLY